ALQPCGQRPVWLEASLLARSRIAADTLTRSRLASSQTGSLQTVFYPTVWGVRGESSSSDRTTLLTPAEFLFPRLRSGRHLLTWQLRKSRTASTPGFTSRRTFFFPLTRVLL